jgi:hypothetical protein
LKWPARSRSTSTDSRSANWPNFIANARFAGAKDNDRVEVIAEDNLGNPTTPHTISVTVQ